MRIDHETQRDSDARASRPRLLADVIGQRRVVTNLEFAVRASRKLGEPLGHILLSGPAGLGKTSLAQVVANELGSRFWNLHAPLV